MPFSTALVPTDTRPIQMLAHASGFRYAPDGARSPLGAGELARRGPLDDQKQQEERDRERHGIVHQRRQHVSE